MTIAHILECQASKVAALRGIKVDATAFDPRDDYGEQLHKMGFQRHGNEPMWCGKTGKRINAQIFIGPTYYQVSTSIHIS